MMKIKITSPNRSVFVLILVLLFCTPALALTPEIYSVDPDHGANNSTTDITIQGDNFEANPNVGLYGGGPTIVGSADTPGYASDVYVSGNYAYVANLYGSSLQIVDISDPINLTIVGSVDISGEV